MGKKRINDDLGGQILRTFADLNETVGNRFDRVDRDLAEIRDSVHRLEKIFPQDHESRLKRVEEKLGIR